MEMQAQGVQEYVVFFFFSIHDFPSYFNKVLLTVLLCQIVMWIQVIFFYYANSKVAQFHRCGSEGAECGLCDHSSLPGRGTGDEDTAAPKHFRAERRVL